jgi:hypothetical protein
MLIGAFALVLAVALALASHRKNDEGRHSPVVAATPPGQFVAGGGAARRREARRLGRPIGDQPLAFQRPSEAGDELQPTVGPFVASDSRRLRVFWVNGQRHELFLMRTEDDLLCLLTRASDGLMGGGCNPTSGPVAGKDIVWHRAQRGGPSLSTITSLIVAGFASSRVERLEYVDSQNGAHALALGRDNEFVRAYAVGDGPETVPVALIAYGRDGSVVERIDLPAADRSD